MRARSEHPHHFHTPHPLLPSPPSMVMRICMPYVYASYKCTLRVPKTESSIGR